MSRPECLAFQLLFLQITQPSSLMVCSCDLVTSFSTELYKTRYSFLRSCSIPAALCLKSQSVSWCPFSSVFANRLGAFVKYRADLEEQQLSFEARKAAASEQESSRKLYLVPEQQATGSQTKTVADRPCHLMEEQMEGQNCSLGVTKAT